MEDTTTPARMAFTVEQAAEVLGCGRDTVYALLRSGALRAVRLGPRTQRIAASEIERFLAGPTEVAS